MPMSSDRISVGMASSSVAGTYSARSSSTGAAGLLATSQVAVQQVAEVHQVLHRQRLVEAPLLRGTAATIAAGRRARWSERLAVTGSPGTS